MSFNDEVNDRWRQRAARARRSRRPMRVTPRQHEELERLSPPALRRHDDGTEWAFGVRVEVTAR